MKCGRIDVHHIVERMWFWTPPGRWWVCVEWVWRVRTSHRGADLLLDSDVTHRRDSRRASTEDANGLIFFFFIIWIIWLGYFAIYSLIHTSKPTANIKIRAGWPKPDEAYKPDGHYRPQAHERMSSSYRYVKATAPGHRNRTHSQRDKPERPHILNFNMNFPQ